MVEVINKHPLDSCPSGIHTVGVTMLESSHETDVNLRITLKKVCFRFSEIARRLFRVPAGHFGKCLVQHHDTVLYVY